MGRGAELRSHIGVITAFFCRLIFRRIFLQAIVSDLISNRETDNNAYATTVR